MGKSPRLKRRRKAATLNPMVIQAFNRGFSDGAKEQRDQDNELLVKKLQGLTSLKRVGEKTAERIIEYFLKGLKK
jgi:DNA uptake protein ComE-like DNA-binding protein